MSFKANDMSDPHCQSVRVYLFTGLQFPKFIVFLLLAIGNKMNKTILLLLLGICFGLQANALNPKKEYTHSPHDNLMKYEEFMIPSSNGAQLSAWFFPSKKGDQMIIMSHDGVGNMGDYIERVRILVDYGFSVLSYDYRGFGSSSNFSIDNTIYVYKEFYEDFEAVYNYCVANYDKPLFAYGWGIGAGITLVKGFDKPKLSGIIVDDPFVSFNKLKAAFRDMNAVMKIPSNIDNSSFEPLSAVTRKPGAMLSGLLVLHGKKNFIINENDISELYDNINLSFKDLYIFKQASMMNNFNVNESEYARQIYGFAINL